MGISYCSDEVCVEGLNISAVDNTSKSIFS